MSHPRYKILAIKRTMTDPVLLEGGWLDPFIIDAGFYEVVSDNGTNGRQPTQCKILYYGKEKWVEPKFDGCYHCGGLCAINPEFNGLDVFAVWDGMTICDLVNITRRDVSEVNMRNDIAIAKPVYWSLDEYIGFFKSLMEAWQFVKLYSHLASVVVNTSLPLTPKLYV